MLQEKLGRMAGELSEAQVVQMDVRQRPCIGSSTSYPCAWC